MKRIFTLVSMMVAFGALSASAATYYVKPDGDDDNDGQSWDTAFATPNKGFSTINVGANRGSDLIIDTGTYALTGAIGCNGGSGESKRSFVSSRTGNPNDVVLYSDGTFECLRLASYIQVSGITFSNGVNIVGGSPAGGIRFAGSKPNNVGEHPTIVSNCIVTCCQNVYGSGTNGAAVVLYYNDLLVDSVIRNNAATKWCGGGVLMVDYTHANRVTGGPVMKGCRIEGNSAESNGAGVHVANYSSRNLNAFGSTDVTIEDCEIIGNSAANGAGLLCVTNMTVTMTGCIMSNNVATGNSGGVRLENGCNLSMRDSVVSENRAGSGAGIDVISKTASLITALSCSNTEIRGNIGTGSGGGVRAYGNSKVFFDDCLVESNKRPKTGGGVDVVPHSTFAPVLSCKGTVFRSNEAENAGGAVGISGLGQAFFDECRFDNNHAVTASQQDDHGGGGIFLYGQTIDERGYCSVSNCVFAGNASNTRAGGMGGTWNKCYFGGAIVNCVFTNNISRLQGGGLVIRDNVSDAFNPDPPIIRNCLFAFNSTTNLTTDTNGGAVMFAAYSNITLENCTIVSNNICNTAGFKSGGIHHRYGGKLKNCIVAFNTVQDNLEGDSWTLNEAAYQNCCGWPGVSKFTAANGCVAADPKFVDPANGDFTLQPGSPCKNAGANAAWMADATDLLGNPRIAGDAVDIGCYEFEIFSGLRVILR